MPLFGRFFFFRYNTHIQLADVLTRAFKPEQRNKQTNFANELLPCRSKYKSTKMLTASSTSNSPSGLTEESTGCCTGHRSSRRPCCGSPSRPFQIVAPVGTDVSYYGSRKGLCAASACPGKTTHPSTTTWGLPDGPARRIKRACGRTEGATRRSHFHGRSPSSAPKRHGKHV